MMNRAETRLGGYTATILALPAGGIRRPHLRRLTHWGRRRCGSAWSLRAIQRRYDEASKKGDVK